MLFRASGLGILGFGPLFSQVRSYLDARRFGTFQYADYALVRDSHVEHYLPQSATQITIHKHGMGFEAKFQIGAEALEAWFDHRWKIRNQQPSHQR